MPEVLAPDTLARARSRVADLEEARVAAQQHFDDLTADATDDSDAWAQLQDLDADIRRARASLAAAERNAAADVRNRDEAATAKRRRDAEKAYAKVVDKALRFEAHIEAAAAMWPEVESAWREFEAVTPESEAIGFGAAAKPPAVMSRVMERFRQTLAPNRPASTEVRIEPLSKVLGRKASGLMSWIGI